MTAHGRAAGFTIIELMIVIAIIGVLAAIAIPAFDELIRNNRRTTVANELLSNLMLARAESAKRGQRIIVCGTPDADVECATNGNWDYGWLIYADTNADGDADADEVVRRYVNDSGNTVRSDAGGRVNMEPFNRGGTRADITICDKRGAAKARAVVVELNGRSRISEKDGDGNALTCP